MYDFSHDPRSAFAQQLLAHWREIKTDDDVPLRGRLNPSQLKDSLARIFIADRVAEGDMRFRLVGEAVRNRNPGAVKGADLLDVFASGELPVAVRLIERALSTPCGVFTTHCLTQRSRLINEAEVVFLPLKSEADKPCDSVVGVANVVPRLPPSTDPDEPFANRLTSWRFLDIGFGVPEGT